MPKGNKYGSSISVKANGMRAIAGQTGVVKRSITISQARKDLSLEQMKQSMNSKPSKENILLKTEGGQMLMKMNETLVNKSNYQELRNAKDMSIDLSRKVKDALENKPEEMKSQTDINNYVASAIGGKQGELLKKMLEMTVGK